MTLIFLDFKMILNMIVPLSMFGDFS